MIELTTGDEAVLAAVKRANEEGRPFREYEAAFVLTGAKIGVGGWHTWTDEEKAAFKLAGETFAKLYHAGLLHSGHNSGWQLGKYGQ